MNAGNHSSEDTAMPLSTDEFNTFVTSELLEVDKRMDELETVISSILAEQNAAKVLLAENTETINHIKSDTAEIIVAFDSWQGAMHVLNWVGSFARPVSYIVAFGASVAALWAAIKSGNSPK